MRATKLEQIGAERVRLLRGYLPLRLWASLTISPPERTVVCFVICNFEDNDVLLSAVSHAHGDESTLHKSCWTGKFQSTALCRDGYGPAQIRTHVDPCVRNSGKRTVLGLKEAESPVTPCGLPRVYRETGNSREMAGVPRDDSLSGEERNRPDHGVHVSDRLPPPFEVGDNSPVFFSRRSVQRKDRERSEDSSDACEGSCGIARKMSPAEELGHVDRRRSNRLPLAGEKGQFTKGVGMSPNEADKAVGVENRHYRSTSRGRARLRRP